MSEFAQTVAGVYLMYLRKSRQDDPNETIEEVLSKHETMLQEYMKREYGFTIPEENIYREVCSGESIEERTEIKRVLKRIEGKSVCGVVCVEPSRLSRGDLLDCGKLVQDFRYTKTLIVTPTMTYNLENKMERKFFQDELLRGNDYLEYTKEVLFRGRVASAKRGNFVGNHPPYGYDRIKVGKDWMLQPNDNAIYVKMMFDWYVEGMSTKAIANKLNDMSIPPLHAKKWDESSIRGILINKHYLGKIVFATTKETMVIENGVRKKKTIAQSEDQAIIVDGKHSAIIDEETFRKANERRSMNAPKIKTGYRLANPLAGLLYCSKCGRLMRLRYQKNYEARFSCNNHPACHKSATLSTVMNAVISALELSELPTLESMLNSNDESHLKAHQSLVSSIQRQLTELYTQQEKQYDLLEKGIYSEDVFIKRNADLKEKIDSTKKKLEEIKNNAPKNVDYGERIMTLKKAIKSLKNKDLSPADKNKLLKSIVERIEYSNTGKRYQFGESDISLEITLRL